MIARKLIAGLLYLIFTTLAIAYLYGTVKEFFEGRTSYSLSVEDVTVFDLPALTVCLAAKNASYRLIYGKDTLFTANIFEQQEESMDLFENKAVKTKIGIELHLHK